MKLALFIIIFSTQVFSKDYIVKIKSNSIYNGSAKTAMKFLGNNYLVIESNTFPNHPSFEIVEEDRDIFLLSNTDPTKQKYFNKQWAIQNLGKNEPITPGRMSPVGSTSGIDTNLLEAWKQTKGDKNIVVAVVDTGIDLKHIELKDNLWTNDKELNGQPGVDDDANGFIDDIYGYDFSAKDSTPQDENGHGTHCAGIIGASHKEGRVLGVMGNVSLMALRTLDSKGAGKVSQAIEAFIYAIENGANIISNSWGSRGHSQVLEDIIKNATQKNIHIIAAAGNSRFNNNDENATYPANYPGVISVGAINARARHAAYSSFGPNTVHISAPGTNIISSHILRKKEIYRVMSGTSMAAPYVSGAIGLYLSLHGPNQSTESVQKALIKTSVPLDHLRGLTISEGMLNITELLKY